MTALAPPPFEFTEVQGHKYDDGTPLVEVVRSDGSDVWDRDYQPAAGSTCLACGGTYGPGTGDALARLCFPCLFS